MENYKFTEEEYKNIGNYLLLELGMAGVMTESQVKKMHAHSKILNESVEVDEDIASILEERSGNLAPIKVGWDGQYITVEFGYIGSVKELHIHPQTVREVWQNPRYQHAEQLLTALGVDIDIVKQLKDTAISSRVNAILDKYNNNYVPSTPGAYKLAAVGKRKQAYFSGRPPEDASRDYVEPTIDDVNAGKRGRKDPLIVRINSSDIVPGEFYRDITRISRSTRHHWVKFWGKGLRTVQKNKKNLLGHLIGKTWKKTFLLGYQVNKTLFYEVWYNSMDSSFSVYDKNGVEVSASVPTLQESIRLLIRTIAQEANTDSEVFATGSGGAALSQSLQRALSPDLGKEEKRIEQEQRNIRAELKREEQERSEARANVKAPKPQKKTRSPAVKERKARMDSSRRAREERERRERVEKAAIDRMNAASASGAANDTAFADRVKGSVSSAFNGMKDVPPEPKKNVMTSRDATTDSMIDQMQKEMDNQQIEEYRQNLEYILGRLRDQADKLRRIAEDPHDNNLLKDPSIRDFFKDVNTDGDRTALAVEAALAYEAHGMEMERMLDKEGADFSEELRKKMERNGRDYATSTEKHMNMVFRDLFGKDRPRNSNVDPYLKENEDPRWTTANQNYQDAIDGFDGDRREKRDAVRAQNSAMGHDPFAEITGRAADQQAKDIRNKVKNSPYTKQVLIQDISESIESYDITRIRHSRIKNIIPRWLGKTIDRLTRGRKDPRQSPTDVLGGFFSRVKQAYLDREYRADFIIGYTLNNVIDIEVWYITELDPNGSGRLISSFYVYDVSAEKVVRSHLPYYRNAMQVVGAKLGITGRGL